MNYGKPYKIKISPFSLRVLILFVLVLLIGPGCDKDEDEAPPPVSGQPTDTTDMPVDTILEVIQEFDVSSSSADFPSGEVIVLSAEFNFDVEWNIAIEGTESGSIKEFAGTGATITEFWDGSTTSPPLFKQEEVIVTLSLPDWPEYNPSLSLEILETKTYLGSLITDFEADSDDDILLGDFEFELVNSGRRNDITAAQGEYYYRLAGTDNPGGGPTDNFFVGLVNILSSINDVTYFEVPTTVPENLYFNFFVRGRQAPYTRIVVGLIIDTNDSGAFEEGQDNVHSLEFDPTYEGWRLESFTGAEFGASQADLEKVVGIQVVLISLNNLQPDPREEVGFEMDYLTFTQNGPFDL